MKLQKQAVNILDNPDSASIKRLAWALGCAKKDSDQEVQLYRILVERIEKERNKR